MDEEFKNIVDQKCHCLLHLKPACSNQQLSTSTTGESVVIMGPSRSNHYTCQSYAEQSMMDQQEPPEEWEGTIRNGTLKNTQEIMGHCFRCTCRAACPVVITCCLPQRATPRKRFEVHCIILCVLRRTPAPPRYRTQSRKPGHQSEQFHMDHGKLQ
jgi:hypothetical protein